MLSLDSQLRPVFVKYVGLKVAFSFVQSKAINFKVIFVVYMAGQFLVFPFCLLHNLN